MLTVESQLICFYANRKTARLKIRSSSPLRPLFEDSPILKNLPLTVTLAGRPSVVSQTFQRLYIYEYILTWDEKLSSKEAVYQLIPIRNTEETEVTLTILMFDGPGESIPPYSSKSRPASGSTPPPPAPQAPQASQASQAPQASQRPAGRTRPRPVRGDYD